MRLSSGSTLSNSWNEESLHYSRINKYVHPTWSFCLQEIFRCFFIPWTVTSQQSKFGWSQRSSWRVDTTAIGIGSHSDVIIHSVLFCSNFPNQKRSIRELNGRVGIFHQFNWVVQRRRIILWISRSTQCRTVASSFGQTSSAAGTAVMMFSRLWSCQLFPILFSVFQPEPWMTGLSLRNVAINSSCLASLNGILHVRPPSATSFAWLQCMMTQ